MVRGPPPEWFQEREGPSAVGYQPSARRLNCLAESRRLLAESSVGFGAREAATALRDARVPVLSQYVQYCPRMVPIRANMFRFRSVFGEKVCQDVGKTRIGAQKLRSAGGICPDTEWQFQESENPKAATSRTHSRSAVGGYRHGVCLLLSELEDSYNFCSKSRWVASALAGPLPRTQKHDCHDCYSMSALQGEAECARGGAG